MCRRAMLQRGGIASPEALESRWLIEFYYVVVFWRTSSSLPDAPQEPQTGFTPSHFDFLN
jgi:hypothetical protein